MQMEMHSETEQSLYREGRSALDSGLYRKESRRDHPANDWVEKHRNRMRKLGHKASKYRHKKYDNNSKINRKYVEKDKNNMLQLNRITF